MRNKNQEKINAELAKQYKRKKALLINAIIEAASNLKRMKVTPKEIMDGIIFPFEAYSRPGSKQMIRAIKNGNLQEVKDLISKDRYLMYIHVRFPLVNIVKCQTNSPPLGSQKKSP